MKKEITVYANRFNTCISTDIKDIIAVATNAGDIQRFCEWAKIVFNVHDFLNLLNDYATTEEVKEELQLHYEMYCLERAKYLIENLNDSYWSDTFIIEI